MDERDHGDETNHADDATDDAHNATDGTTGSGNNGHQSDAQPLPELYQFVTYHLDLVVRAIEGHPCVAQPSASAAHDPCMRIVLEDLQNTLRILRERDAHNIPVPPWLCGIYQEMCDSIAALPMHSILDTLTTVSASDKTHGGTTTTPTPG